jgi:hypothetical protein
MLKFELKIITSFLFIFITLIYFSSCATLTGYQDGRTIGEGNGEAMISLNISKSPNYNEDEDIDLDNFPLFVFPNIEIGGRYGISEKADINLRFNTNFNFSAGGKYQLVGDRSSDFALSAGAELGSIALTLWNIQIPVYMSFHPNDNVAFYISPRYIHQFNSFAAINNWNYVGGNIGFLFGRRHKFGIDAGFYQANASGTKKIALSSFGIGGKFVFGNNMADSPKSGPKKKRKKQL